MTETGVEYLFVVGYWQPRTNAWYEKARVYWFEVIELSAIDGPHSYVTDGSGYGPYPKPGEIPGALANLLQGDE